MAARLLIPKTLAARELGRDSGDRDEVIGAWRKRVFAELPAKGWKGVRLLKAYVTTSRGARRTLFLLQVASGDAVFLLHRRKGDAVGDNMSHRNPVFSRAVESAMVTALKDIEAGRFDVVERDPTGG
jgi:hypothetical protein